MSRSGVRVAQRADGGQRGQVTIFGIGLVVMLLVIGGVSLDLWRVVAEHRALAEVADAAAAAGSNGVDVDHYRTTGDVVLDVDLARSFAAWSMETQDLPTSYVSAELTTVEPGRITIAVRGRVDLSLLSLIAPGDGVDIEVEASASPRRSGG